MKYYKKADELVVVNPVYIQELVDIGIDKEKISYIPNYVSNKEFYKLKKTEINMIKERYDIPKNKFIVLGVGQVQNRKGVLDFITVAENNPDIEFIWAGGFSFGRITDGYKLLKDVISNPPINVKFLGVIDRRLMNDIYNICDLFFLPSYSELFPMSILEAVSVNKPCLLRDLKLYEDILFSKYEKGTNNAEFSLKINELKNDGERYREAVENAKYIKKYYSKEHVLKLWEEYYKKILTK
jgi:1,2-diacylglycerol-3-alpha-glucose alpha-1,2-galactosyltransferase